MQIIFGMNLDGARWSDQSASLGRITLGPLSFLAWLEERIGLSGADAPLPVRIEEYRKKMEAVKPAWCASSFELDAWSTAKQLLAWRDELVENGWDGKTEGSGRLAALAAIEANPGKLSPGIPDRMKSVLAELPNFTFSDTLTVRDPVELLPEIWRQIIEQLKSCGMNVSFEKTEVTNRPAMLRLNGADEFTLSQELVRYLKASPDNSKVAILCEGNSSVLDGALHRAGFGQIGNAEKSRWRESLQILPLWLEMLWKPFNPQRFLETLLLPVSPIPGVMTRHLVDALLKAPGFGGEVWNNAIQEALTDAKDEQKKKCEDIIPLLNRKCFYAENEVDATAIIDRCDFLMKFLQTRVKDNPELKLVMDHCKTLKRIVSGKERVKRMELARMLDSIISTGTGGGSGREVTDFAVYTKSGLIDAEYDTILWWNFVNPGTASSTNWTEQEKAVMPYRNIHAQREREARSWHNVLNHAKQVIFFVPSMVDGEAVFPHPLLDEFPDLKGISNLVTETGLWSLGDRQMALEEQKVFAPVANDVIDRNEIGLGRRLSHTQMEKLLTCPFQWFMMDYLGLKMPPAMSVPSGEMMIGTLAHKVIEEIYRGREQLTVDEAKMLAAQKFKQLVPEMAGELLLEGHSVEHRRIEKTLLRAVETLVTEINKRGLLVKGNEKKLPGKFGDIDFVGYADIYLEDASGKPFVIDMKWSSSSYYEKKIGEDKALQLATYSWLLDPEELNVKCAYFLFPKQQFIHDPVSDWKGLWEKAKQTWEQRFASLHDGKLEFGTADKKELEKSNLPLSMPASCGFCKLKVLCEMLKKEEEK